MRRLGFCLLLLVFSACDSDTMTPSDGGTDAGVAMCAESMTYTYPGCGTCRADSECEDLELNGTRAGSFLACFVQGAARQPLPGARCVAQRDCEDATTCGADEICHEFQEAFCEGLTSRCQTSCDVSGCGDGERCNTDGVCERIPCDEAGATACGDNESCVDSQCVVDTCTVDEDCATGPYCVRGLCRARLGNCLAIARP